MNFIWAMIYKRTFYTHFEWSNATLGDNDIADNHSSTDKAYTAKDASQCVPA